jgi:predicted O-methyltransferase YrrM
MKKVVGSLEDTLAALAEYTKAFVDDFWTAAYEDKHSGWDFGKGSWPCGSLHTTEGQTLYALVCALELRQVVECGSLYGCSSSHIAQALKDTKVATYPLISVDILEGTGSMFPDDLKPYRKQFYAAGEKYLATLPDNSVDMVYEDTDHTYEVTRAIWEAAIPKVRSGGVIVSHDSEHATAGEVVTKAVLDALGHDDVLTLLVPPADCGLLVWRKP